MKRKRSVTVRDVVLLFFCCGASLSAEEEWDWYLTTRKMTRKIIFNISNRADDDVDDYEWTPRDSK